MLGASFGLIIGLACIVDSMNTDGPILVHRVFLSGHSTTKAASARNLLVACSQLHNNISDLSFLPTVRKLARTSWNIFEIIIEFIT